MGLTFAILAFIFVALIASISFYKDIKISNWIKIVIITGLVVGGILDIVFKSTDDTLAKKIDSSDKHSDSSFTKLHSYLEKKFKNPNQANIHKKSFADLRLALVPTNNNPQFIITDKADSSILKLGICNFGTSVAYDLKNYACFIQIINGSPKFISLIRPLISNKSTVIYPDNTQNVPYFLPFVGDFTKYGGTLFFCFKIDYSDSTKTEKHFKKILNLQGSENRFYESSNTDYDIIEAFLIKSKIW
jgi:hypothetical protein